MNFLNCMCICELRFSDYSGTLSHKKTMHGQETLYEEPPRHQAVEAKELAQGWYTLRRKKQRNRKSVNCFSSELMQLFQGFSSGAPSAGAGGKIFTAFRPQLIAGLCVFKNHRSSNTRLENHLFSMSLLLMKRLIA
jgi:hypothetical protein